MKEIKVNRKTIEDLCRYLGSTRRVINIMTPRGERPALYLLVAVLEEFTQDKGMKTKLAKCNPLAQVAVYCD